MKKALVFMMFIGGVFACSGASSTNLVSGDESCTVGDACGASGNIEICTTRDVTGACGAVTYKTSKGDSFRCNTCNDCATAIVDVNRACKAGSSSSSGGSSSGGSSSGGSSSGGSSSGGSSSGGHDGGWYDAGTDAFGDDATTTSCVPTPGSYNAHYVLKSDGGGTTACSTIPDQTVTVSASDGGAYDAGPGCSQSIDSLSCTYTTDCTSTSGSYMTTSHVVATVTSTQIYGETHSTTTSETDGTVVYDCTYGFTETKL